MTESLFAQVEIAVSVADWKLASAFGKKVRTTMTLTTLESVRGDEYFTLEKDAETIAQHIIRPMKVWLPFNDRGGAFEKVLPAHGHKVVCTDTDFFTTNPPDDTECVISNPPFSRKKEVVKRLDELGLKYALIVPFLWLNDGIPFDHATQLMMFRKRMHFTLTMGGGGTKQTKTKLRCNQQRHTDTRFYGYSLKEADDENDV